MNQDPENFPQSTIESIQVVDIRPGVSEENVTMTRTFAVKEAVEDRGDFVVHVMASRLYRCRSKLQQIKEARFPVGETLFGIGTAGLGATGGAWTSGVKLDSLQGLIFLILTPIVTVGCLVAYGFYRHMSITSASQIAADVLAELPDPDRASEMGQKNES